VTNGNFTSSVKVEIESADPAGDGVAGIDLGIKNIATIAFPDEYVLYPGNSLKEQALLHTC